MSHGSVCLWEGGGEERILHFSMIISLVKGAFLRIVFVLYCRLPYMYIVCCSIGVRRTIIPKIFIFCSQFPAQNTERRCW